MIWPERLQGCGGFQAQAESVAVALARGCAAHAPPERDANSSARGCRRWRLNRTARDGSAACPEVRLRKRRQTGEVPARKRKAARADAARWPTTSPPRTRAPVPPHAASAGCRERSNRSARRENRRAPPRRTKLSTRDCPSPLRAAVPPGFSVPHLRRPSPSSDSTSYPKPRRLRCCLRRNRQILHRRTTTPTSPPTPPPLATRP